MLKRRSLIKAMAATGFGGTLIAALPGCSLPKVPMLGEMGAKTRKAGEPAHVVVIGGGFGGASVAKYLKRFDSSVNVTLIEPKQNYMTCPGSNWYLAGLVDAKFITHNYDALKTKHGVSVIHSMVTKVSPSAMQVTLKDGRVLDYDRLVVSPGIDFNYDAIEGYSEANINDIPHAYQAGPQTEILYKQLREMPQGGTFVMCPPGNPFRCPPGPYERASMVADFFKRENPTAKIVILDAKEKFSKQGLFQEGWAQLYGDMIEWIPASSGGKVLRVDAATKTVFTDFGEHKADVLNIIPPQKAGKIAFTAGLTNEKGWCPINQKTFESTIHPNIHVIGDSSISGKMPKSGHSAASQGKMCAAAIVSLLNGKDVPVGKNVNTCYSLVSADYGISVAAVYVLNAEGQIVGVKDAGGVSPKGADTAFRLMEAKYADGWYKAIAMDLWKS
ncbi:cytochrome c [Thiosulfatimonas sediminis]|uniref:Cytochrome c n=1 Tax=Thiosulfatimonas sediminis TaxID=2675054 RepID=A0A6F8PX18_9GAMM|nr:NAD(P)/FAD-dependent oxidoreductase [Thiosulfatimonas sediminis]BBP46693.1 cytochrome c [Thiosulfatimonas sediminis]